MKKKIIILLICLMIVILLLFFGIGGRRTDVFLNEYELSDDSQKLKISVGVASSMGYVRTLRVKQGGDNQYITFYSTFGLNNKLGAKNEFEIELNPSCEEIYFYSGDGGYRLVLQKNSENEWEIPTI